MAGGRCIQCSVYVELSVHGKTVVKSRWSLKSEVAHARFYCTLIPGCCAVLCMCDELLCAPRYLKGLPIEEGFQDKHPTVTQDKPDLLEGSKAIEDDIGSQVAEAFSAEAVAMANCQPLALPSGLHVIKTGEGMEIMAKYEYVRGRMKDFAETDFQPNYVYKLEKFGWKRISSRKSPWGTKVRVWFLATQAEDE